jgi:hypothetical protein
MMTNLRIKIRFLAAHISLLSLRNEGSDCIRQHVLLRHQIKEDKMNGTRSMHTKFLSEYLKEEDHMNTIYLFVKNTIFWDITPCSPLKVNRSFGRTYLLHLQGQKIIQQETSITAGLTLI